jgi:hypothetical protein
VKLYQLGDLTLHRSCTRRLSFHWRDPDGDTGYMPEPLFWYLRAAGALRRR